MNDAMGMPQTAVVLGGSSEIARAVLAGRWPRRRLRHVVLAGRDEVGPGRQRPRNSRRSGTDEVDTVDLRRHRRRRATAPSPATWPTRLGHVDLVLVAAGVLGDQAVDEHDPEATARVLTTNYGGAGGGDAGVRRRPARPGDGRMVVLSSVAGVRVRRANFVYGASKAGPRRVRPGTGRVAARLGRGAHDRPPRLGGHPHDGRSATGSDGHHARRRGRRRRARPRTGGRCGVVAGAAANRLRRAATPPRRGVAPSARVSVTAGNGYRPGLRVVEVFADVLCPFTYVGLRRLAVERDRRRRRDVVLRCRAWPLELVNGRPLDPAEVAEEVAALRRSVAPGLFRGFDAATFPRSSLRALTLAADADAVSVELGESVSFALPRRVVRGGSRRR